MVYYHHESEEFVCIRCFLSAMAIFEPRIAYQAMQCHTSLCNGLTHLYYSLTTLQNNHILPQHDENNSR